MATMLAQRNLAGRQALAPSAPSAILQLPPRCPSTVRRSKISLLQHRQLLAPSYGRLHTSSPVCSTAEQQLGAQRSANSESLQSLRVPATGMAKGLGSFSGGATLEKSKLDRRQKQTSWTPSVDNSGGGGGIGKGIFNGGGGGDDGGDDDDYYEFDDGDDSGGDGGFFRMLIEENYSMAAIKAVLSEWFRTIDTLPLILRQAVQMGLFSSQQLVRFCAMDNRPTITRTVQRSLPASVSRGLVGRMMADPAFLQKLLMESVICTSSSLLWEAQQRGERFSHELDLVAINTLSLAAANVALVWSIAPSRSFGSPAKLPWQRMLAKLPNHAFDVSGPQRSYTYGTRAASFVAKIGTLAGVGAVAGAAMSLLGGASTALRQRSDPSYQPSVAPPRLPAAAAGLGTSMGLSSNVRYQIIAGIDTYLFGHSNYLWSYLAFSGVMRLASNAIGQDMRLFLMGLPRGEPVQTATQPQRAAQQPVRRAATSDRPASAQSGSTTRPKTKKRVKKSADRGFAMSAGAAA